MVSFWRINYPFQKGGTISLIFVSEICSLELDGNTNPDYLDVEDVLSTPSAVEMTSNNPHKNQKGKCEWWSETIAAKSKNLFQNILRNIIILD